MNSEQKHKHLLFALQRVIRSLARLLIRVGIRFEEFSAIAKSVYVESAVRDSGHRGVPSRARIAVLTGLTGRDIDSYIDGDGRSPTSAATLRALLVEILHNWHTIPEYVGPYGIPLELEFSTPADRCFSSLVALVDPGANPNIVLAELLRGGAILRAGKDRFRPISRFFMMPNPASPHWIERFGMSLSRLAATLEYNMDSKHAEKLFQRSVTADRGLPVELIPAFEKYVRAKAADLLLGLDNWLASHASDSESGDSYVDTGVNVFLYVEHPGTTEPLATLVDRPGVKGGANG